MLLALLVVNDCFKFCLSLFYTHSIFYCRDYREKVDSFRLNQSVHLALVTISFFVRRMMEFVARCQLPTRPYLHIDPCTKTLYDDLLSQLSKESCILVLSDANYPFSKIYATMMLPNRKCKWGISLISSFSISLRPSAPPSASQSYQYAMTRYITQLLSQPLLVQLQCLFVNSFRPLCPFKHVAIVEYHFTNQSMYNAVLHSMHLLSPA
jgi:hypothetical protein